MKLDEELAREIKKQANGDGSREARLSFLSLLRATARELSTPEVMRTYGETIRDFGRVPVAICTAVTIRRRKDRLDPSTVRWAYAVLELWKNAPPDPMDAYIADNLHPSRIEQYAGEFIRLTTEEE